MKKAGKNTFFLEQGDVLAKPIAKSDIPKGLVKATGKNAGTLQFGELTGHAHRLDGLEGDFEVYYDPQRQDKNGNGPKFLIANDDCVLKHEEHKSFIVPAGVYDIGTVQEYDHFEKLARAVRD